MNDILNYTLGLNGVYPNAATCAGVQGDHNRTALVFNCDEELMSAVLEEEKKGYSVYFKIDVLNTAGETFCGNERSFEAVSEPFYLTSQMTLSGLDVSVLVRIIVKSGECIVKEVCNAVIPLYFKTVYTAEVNAFVDGDLDIKRVERAKNNALEELRRYEERLEKLVESKIAMLNNLAASAAEHYKKSLSAADRAMTYADSAKSAYGEAKKTADFCDLKHNETQALAIKAAESANNASLSERQIRTLTDEYSSILNTVCSQTANSLKGNKYGNRVAIHDLSPLEHKIECTAESKNILQYPFSGGSFSENGIFFKDNGDGSITVNGTATADCTYVFKNILLKGTYTLSGCTNGGMQAWFLGLGSSDFPDIGNGVTRDYVSEMPQNVFVRIRSGYMAKNLVVRPQLEKGFKSTPYSAHIKDVYGASVTVCGKNLFDKSNTAYFVDGYVNSDGAFTENGDYKSIIFKCLRDTDYTLSNLGTTEIRVVGFKEAPAKNAIGTVLVDKSVTSHTSFNSRDAEYAVIFFEKMMSASVKKLQIEYGKVATEYEPYNGQAYTVSKDGCINGIKSGKESLTLLPSDDGILLNVRYNRDVNMAYAELANKI